jgi:hypothetical protein
MTRLDEPQPSGLLSATDWQPEPGAGCEVAAWATLVGGERGLRIGFTTHRFGAIVPI